MRLLFALGVIKMGLFLDIARPIVHSASREHGDLA